MAHVLVVPYPSQGHMNPMVQFARKLASKGVAVTVVTTRFIERTTSSSAGGGGLDACPGVRVEAISDGHDEGGVASAASLEDAVYHYVHEGKLAVPAPEQELATSRSAAFAGLPEMERRELPSFVLGDGPYPTLAVFALSQFADAGKDDWVLFNSFDELESEVLAGLSTQWKARAIGPCVPLPAGDGATGRFTYGANLLDPEDTCMQWLDTKPPSSVAYVSFGSFASLGAAQTEELARGLLAAGRPFLWVVRATEEAQLPRHLLDAATASGNALVVRWSPQLDVLAHRATGCFVTHCGWNSTLEALGFGVPMVALPLWTDQPTNALLVERAWGAGVRARRGDADADDAAGGTAAMFLRGEIERCVRAVMDGEEQEAARARARGEARRWSDAARAAVSPGGSSDRSLDEFVEFLRGGSGASAGEKWKALVREGSEAAASEM
uniref:Glycosyltransferase n=1 Tax=Oryza glumipatula TaxID=40148 RepID=A0A0D9ZBW7_9ORYZ